MFVTVDKFYNEINLYVQEEDLCYLCAHIHRCPLYDALRDEAVVPRYEAIHVENCGMYKEFSFDEMIAF